MATLKIYNRRTLELLSDAKHEGKVINDKDWAKKVKINNANLSAVKAGRRDFTLDQMIAAAKISGVSLDWITGRSAIKFMIKEPTLEEVLKQAMSMVKLKTATTK